MQMLTRFNSEAPRPESQPSGTRREMLVYV
jgi:hypothetical protein